MLPKAVREEIYRFIVPLGNETVKRNVKANGYFVNCTTPYTVYHT